MSANPKIKPNDIGCQGALSWQDIKLLSAKVLGTKHYITERITKAIELYHLVTGDNHTNYKGKLSFREIIDKCKKEGANVLVGYHYGISALKNADVEHLLNRKFKWDSKDNPIPPKIPRNWILGDRFLAIIKNNFPNILK